MSPLACVPSLTPGTKGQTLMLSSVVLESERNVVEAADTHGRGRSFNARILSNQGLSNINVVLWGPEGLREDIALSEPYVVIEGRYKDCK